MPTSEELTDTYLAELLKRDAENARNGLPSGRLKPRDAPKPNTRFLRNIIRDTDSHNTALRERNVRLGHHAHKDRLSDDATVKRRKVERPDRWSSVLSGLGEAPRHRHDEGPRNQRRSSHAKPSSSRLTPPPESIRRPTRSRSPIDENKSRRPHHRRRVPSLDDHSRERRHKQPRSREARHVSKRSASHCNRLASQQLDRLTESIDPDSDTNEIGPLPLSSKPRGRGAAAGHSGIDARFAGESEPQVDDDLDDDDWQDALSAAQDRQKWRLYGVDRLRAAGFSEADISRWQESSKLVNAGQSHEREKDANDVVWSKHGESREWDRGKTLTSDGSVEIGSAWTQAGD